MALTLAKKEKIGVFVLATDENGDQATLSYRQIFPDKKSAIMRKHSSVFYSTDVNKARKGKAPQESKIYLDNDSVEATMEILKYCVTDIFGVVDEDGNPYTRENIDGVILFNLLDMVDKLDEFIDVVSGKSGDATTKN